MLNRKLFLNILCEFGPIIAFLITYTLTDFESGTIAIIIATVAALILLKVTEHHLPLFAIFSTATVVVFGGISLIIHIPGIFILRDTIFDTAFGVILIGSVLMKKPLLKPLFHNVFGITDRGWSILSLRWGLFFLFLATWNEWVRQTLTADEWVSMKVYMIIATLIFGFYQFRLAKRERLPDASPWGLVR